MTYINRRVDAMNNVQKAIVELAGIPAAAPRLIEAIASLREVRKELAYEIFRDNYEDGGMSDEEKRRRCAATYAQARGKDPHRAYVPCVVDGATHITCKDCPLARVPP